MSSSWFLRIDRFADPHLCYAQEASMSCGLACVKMVVFKVNKLRIGASATSTEDRIESIYLKHDKRITDVKTQGTFGDKLPKVLNRLNVGHWKHAAPAANKITDLVIEKIKNGPVIVGVAWAGGGGHWVVCDAIHKMPFTGTVYGAMCDPGDANVHITELFPGKALQYAGALASGVNFWGSPKHSYSKGASIVGTSDEIVYCDSPPK